jgi:hypothetical protein
MVALVLLLASGPLAAPKPTPEEGCRGRDTGRPVPPSQIPAGGFPGPNVLHHICCVCELHIVQVNLWDGL